MFCLIVHSTNSNFRSSRPEVFCKKVLLKISQNSQESTCARVFFIIKLQASGLQPFLIEHLRCLLLYLRQSYKYVFCYMAFDKAYIHQTKLSLYSVFVQIRVSLRKFYDKMKPFLLNVPSNVLSRSTISS